MSNVIIVSIQLNTYVDGVVPKLHAFSTARKALEFIAQHHPDSDMYFTQENRVFPLSQTRIERVIAYMNAYNRLEMSEGATDIIIEKKEIQ